MFVTNTSQNRTNESLGKNEMNHSDLLPNVPLVRNVRHKNPGGT